ncbi:MAG: trypsin-like serine protease [Candidatus Marinimicrobia bacterium]|jgi:serine protease Do|nr:trypsin-like serine protease [Candidatus Neomarinimicrobiota bacterium]MBT3677067.1 trypsin-like serine protease [Candidatus Neomarinimicrobiota bacterium]MBT3762378.1 trypsin-like serine protease [Candidatus Neomarinimicrobiota bacterium]MBT4069476.1 trypsin-like serine protease [Candidatus Neomarinimicrobiota bacterium]MBT4372663.1 trypsin-like serine protease [Candidatus Neomarinimicrobiota bacterium]
MMTKRINSIWIALCIVIPLSGQEGVEHSRQNAITNAIEHASPAVASINVTQVQRFSVSPFQRDPWFEYFFPPEIRQREVKGSGSGVVISPDGYVLTNDHVVENASKIIVTLPGGEEYNADVVGLDDITDLALLKLEGSNFPYVKMGDSDNLIIGEWVIALGNPFGLFDVNQQPTATIGIVSGKDLDFGIQGGKIFQDMIQTDAAINPGNSGGPLVNGKGEVIGINTFIYTGSRARQGSVGIGFAIPINRARRIAEELKTKGRIVRDFSTGLRAQPLDKKTAEYLDIPFTKGVIVTHILKNSPASKAKLEYGDVIVGVQNEEINSLEDILEIIEINDLRPGDRLKMRVWRNGRYFTKSLILGKL